MSEIANELKIYIEEIRRMQQRDRTSGKYERQVKEMERRMLRALQQQCNCCYTELCRNNDDSEGEKITRKNPRFDEIWSEISPESMKDTDRLTLESPANPKAGKIKKTPLNIL